ncbi:MAG: hypothetical protein FWD81_03880 [Methanomassiliicoccaceae archaeon]|nr:hypothetical protein [Methanomassiliicoccaceae archaeon]
MKKYLGVFTAVAILLIATSFVGGFNPDEEGGEKYVRSINLDDMIMNTSWVLEEYDEYTTEYSDDWLQFNGILSFDASMLFGKEIETMSINEGDILRIENIIEITGEIISITLIYYLGDEFLGSEALLGTPKFMGDVPDAVFEIDGIGVFLSELLQQNSVENCIIFVLGIPLLAGILLPAATAVAVGTAAIMLVDYTYKSFTNPKISLNKNNKTVTVDGSVFPLTELNQNNLAQKTQAGKYYYAALIDGKLWITTEISSGLARKIIEMDNGENNVYTPQRNDALWITNQAGTYAAVGPENHANNGKPGEHYYDHYHTGKFLFGLMRGNVHVFFGAPTVK